MRALSPMLTHACAVNRYAGTNTFCLWRVSSLVWLMLTAQCGGISEWARQRSSYVFFFDYILHSNGLILPVCEYSVRMVWYSIRTARLVFEILQHAKENKTLLNIIYCFSGAKRRRQLWTTVIKVFRCRQSYWYSQLYGVRLRTFKGQMRSAPWHLVIPSRSTTYYPTAQS